MDGQRFDEFTRAFAAGSASRRALIKGVLGGAAAGALGLFRAGNANADNLCKPAGKPQSKCRHDHQCCAGLVCQDRECQPGCRIDGRFYAAGTPHPTEQCQACLPNISTVQWSMQVAGAACDDGDPCTSNDVCDGAGGCAGIMDRPAITCPAGSTISTTAGLCGAVATFAPIASCHDQLSCSHESGATFAVGSTTVTCTATNAAGSTECSFVIVVDDQEDPAITCPASIDASAVGGGTVPVTFMAGATDNCAGVQISCDPPSGSSFGVGTTTVICTATDASGETDSCSFDVVVACVPDCTGKACGETDGCGGICVVPCPDISPCVGQVCDAANKSCVPENKPHGTSCSDQCTFNGICDGSGACINGTTPGCPENTTNPCRERSGTCDPAVGCVYDLLTEGTFCDESNKCNVKTCTADGSCQANSPVECDSECQFCDPATGTCGNIDGHRVLCGEGTGYCSGGVCDPPCPDDCPHEYCMENIPQGQDVGSFFCCPELARFPAGDCCWIGSSPGIVIDGQCLHPLQVCAGGVACDVECCGSDGGGFAGECPAADEYCVGATPVKAGQVCTIDADCTATYGTGAKCAGVDFIFGENGPERDTDSGVCCPGAHAFEVPDMPAPEAVYICCTQGSKPTGPNPGCCDFPDYATCSTCDGCSFGTIRRCC